MSNHSETTRRDRRHKLCRGGAFVEFEIEPSTDGRWRGELTSISAAGLTFEMDTGVLIETGTLLQAVTVLIGECAIEGDLAVRYVRRANESTNEMGCVFYPASHAGAEKWSAVFAGMEAVCAG